MINDASNTILNVILIPRSNLTFYYYNSPEPEVIVGVTIANLRRNTKPIGKKDSLRIYMLPGDPLLYIQPISINVKTFTRNNTNFIKPQMIPLCRLTPGEYERSEDDPNCTIPVVDFCRMCTAMNSISCSHVIIRGYPRGIVFEGMMEGNIAGRIDKFGIVENRALSTDSSSSFLDGFNLDHVKIPKGEGPRLVIESNEPEDKIKVRIATIKALSKLNNLSTQGGIIKIYMEPEAPLKLICNIGSYGRLAIYLRDVDS